MKSSFIRLLYSAGTCLGIVALLASGCESGGVFWGENRQLTPIIDQHNQKQPIDIVVSDRDIFAYLSEDTPEPLSGWRLIGVYGDDFSMQIALVYTPDKQLLRLALLPQQTSEEPAKTMWNGQTIRLNTIHAQSIVLSIDRQVYVLAFE